ncbi:MAG: hypothetical protein JSR56_11255 [Proteobacteria bacterium]|nr:hypothetical protein [Pseudomonadota bacterium]
MSDARAAPATKDTLEQHSPLQAVLPHILKTFRREPALALTVAYLLVALAGIYYDYAYYQKGFGIPILSLAQIGDYLVAGLQQPVAIVLVVITFPLCWFMDRLNVFFRRRDLARRDHLRALPQRDWRQALHLRYLDWHLDQLWGLQIAYLLVIFIYGWIFVGLYARHRVGEVKQGVATQVTVRFTGADTALAASHSPSWSYLGAVSNYVFLYDPAQRQPLVVPVNAIASLRPATGSKPADVSGPVAARP